MAEIVATPLRITIVTPHPRGSRGGNRATALRWAGLLRQLGHRVAVDTGWRGRPTDVLFSVHAVKSAHAVTAALAQHPDLPVVTLLSGTDLYPTFAPDPDSLRALERAAALVALQPHALDVLPDALRARARTIVQSATAAPRARRPGDRAAGAPLRAVVLAHLRPVKQPLLAVEAVARVPADVPLELTVAGGRLDDDYADRFEAVAARTPRVAFLGEVSRRRSKRLLADADVCVVPSSSEGGANVVSEAIATGTPVLCSDVAGNLGLLGEDWPGAFASGDADALAAALSRAATDRPFLDDLCARVARLQPMVSPAAERAALAALLRDVAAR